MDKKRKEFYVCTSVFESGLSAKAQSVFAYLSFCADRFGECFPSLAAIAKECGMCKNTARKAIDELVERGLISRRHRTVRTERGNRQTSNFYRILAERGEMKPAPEPKPTEAQGPAGASAMPTGASGDDGAKTRPEPKPTEAQGPAGASAMPTGASGDDGAKTCSAAGKIGLPTFNTERVAHAASAALAPSAGKAAPLPEIPRADDPEGLRVLLERLGIRDLYYDKTAAKAVELAITDMWFADRTRVCGENISRSRVRRRLEELDINAVDEVMYALAAEEIYDNAAYLKACIFNAPARVSARIAMQCAAVRRERELESDFEDKRRRDKQIREYVEEMIRKTDDGSEHAAFLSSTQ